MTTRKTQESTDYSKFSFLVDNRQTARTHINKLKDAIQRNPEILEVQPILVNEKLEIIDGQHRFVAASELGLPISYTLVKGLNINTAREMNVLQRRWHMDDYAMSYAKAGDLNYKAYNEYRREHPGISGSLLITIMASSESGHPTTDFRSGKFVIKREQADIEWLLAELEHIKEITNGEIPLSRAFVQALTKCIDNADFIYDTFLANLRTKPESFHRTSVVRDSLRMIEDIYNFKKSTNILRLY